MASLSRMGSITNLRLATFGTDPFFLFPWYWVLGVVAILGVLWCLIRYLFVNVAFATIACYIVVWLKWPAAIGSAVYLFFDHRPLPAIIALLWPLLAGFVGIPGKVGVIELAFAKKIGFASPDA